MFRTGILKPYYCDLPEFYELVRHFSRKVRLKTKRKEKEETKINNDKKKRKEKK